MLLDFTDGMEYIIMVASDMLLLWYLIGLFTGVGISIVVILTSKNVEDEDE